MKVIIYGDHIPAEILSVTSELKVEPYPDRKHHYNYIGDFIYDYLNAFIAGQSLFKQARILVDEKAVEAFIQEHKSRENCVVQWTEGDVTNTSFMQITSSQAEHDSKVRQFISVTSSEFRRLMITPDDCRSASRISLDNPGVVRVEIPYETKHGYVIHTYDSFERWNDHFFEVRDAYGTYRLAADTYYDSGSTEIVSFVHIDAADSTIHTLSEPLETKKKGTIKNPPTYVGPSQRPMSYANVGERMACLFQHVPTVPTRIHITQVTQEFGNRAMATIKTANLPPLTYHDVCKLFGHIPRD